MSEFLPCMKTYLLLLVVIHLQAPLLAGDDDSLPKQKFGRENLSLVVGYNVWTYHYAEAGFARNGFGVNGKHPFAFSFYATDEIRVGGNRVIMGPKIGAWIGGGSAFGMALICYTDFRSNAWRIRPEIGIGIEGYRLTYGYNVRLTNSEFLGINSHVLTMTACIGLIKLRDY